MNTNERPHREGKAPMDEAQGKNKDAKRPTSRQPPSLNPDHGDDGDDDDDEDNEDDDEEEEDPEYFYVDGLELEVE